jgi:HK97 family phage major capsid protein
MSDEQALKELDLTELGTEIKALRDALLGNEEAAKALEDKNDEDLRKAFNELKAKVEAQGSPNAPPAPRDPADELKEGKFLPAAFLNGISFANQFGFKDACVRGAKKGTQEYKDASYTLERVLEKQMSTTAGSGGYIVPEEWSTQMIEQLYAQLVTASAGVRRMSGLNIHTVRQPELTGSATAYWVAENGTITASTLTDAQKTLQPNEAAALVKSSNQLIDLSNPSATRVIQDDITMKIAQLVDLAVLRGSGSSNQPTGVANTSSINTVAASSSALTWALLEDFPYELAADNALKGKLAWVMNPRTVHNMKQLTSANRPLFVGSPYNEPIGAGFAGGSLVGYPVYQTTQVPITGGTGSDEAEVYFCNWDDVVLADWGAMEIMASKEADTAFAANQTWIRAIWLVDVMVRHAVSCCVCTDTTS